MRRAAFDEAGHAVAYLALGHGFVRARIYPQPTVSQGGTLRLGEIEISEDERERIYPAVELAVTSLAGPIAEARITKWSLVGVLLGGEGHDYRNAQTYLTDSRFDYGGAE